MLRGSGAEDGLKNMLKKILKQLALKKLLKKKNKQEQPLGQGQELSRDFEKNVELFKKILGKNRDFVQYEFVFGTHEKIRAALFYFEGLVYREYINEFILKPLMFQSHHFSSGELRRGKSIAHLRERLISIGGTEVVSKVDDILNNCLCGDTILLVDGYAEALALNTKGWKTRGVEEPKTEALVRGAREGFTESIGINMALLRRRIRHFEFTIEEMQIGAKTRTKVCIAYLKGVVNTGVLEEVRKRLGRIKTDAILESGYLEQFIEDAPFSIFPTVANSERPDTVAAKILEGRVAIITDGTPMVLTVPLLGKIVSLVYLAYFWHLGSIVLRDFGDFYLAIVYPETPLVVIILLLALLCASAVRNGLEVLGRCSVFLVPIAVFFIIFDSLLLIEKIELSNLLPVLDVPWKDLLKVSHGVATFPFGEAVIFLMVMAFSNNQRQVRKTMFGAMFTAGVLLSWLAARNTGVLGSIVCIQAYPSFPVIRYINLGEIFTRLEIVVAAVLLSLGFIKITVFYYGTVLGLAQLMRLRSYLPLVLPVGAMMVFLGACVFQSNVENINFSFNIYPYYSLPFEIGLPLLSLLVAVIRGVPKPNQGEQSDHRNNGPNRPKPGKVANSKTENGKRGANTG